MTPPVETTPDCAAALTLLATYDVVPIALELPLGGRTPATVMRALGTDGRCFLLESAQRGGPIGGYSFLGHEPVEVSAPDGGDPLKPLEAVAEERVAPGGLLPGVFCGGWVGYLGYEAATCYERLPTAAAAQPQLPVADFALYRSLVIVDHEQARVVVTTQLRAADGQGAAAYGSARRRLDTLARRVLAAEEGRDGTASTPEQTNTAATTAAPPPLADLDGQSTFTRKAFIDSVERCLHHITAGDVFQVQISRRFAAPLSAHPFALYTALRRLNPSPYLFYLATPQCVLVGASPETLVRVRGREITYRPIAGTRRRGRDAAEDAAMEVELHTSEKEQAEHLMLVDLGRNDVGRVAAVGSVRLDDSAIVERYSHVMHLVSGISAVLAPGRTALDALRSCFPAGTVTGAPKIRAMQIIAAEEPHRRGPYAGAVGYIGSGGVLDTAIALRTTVVVDGTAYLQAAAGIVADSQPDEEAREIDNKIAATLAALTEVNAGA